MILKSNFIVFILIYLSNINSSKCQSLYALPPGFNNQVRYIYLDTVSEYLYAGGPFSQLLRIPPVNHVPKVIKKCLAV